MLRPVTGPYAGRSKLDPKFLRPDDAHGYRQMLATLAVFFGLVALARVASAYWLVGLLVFALGSASHRLFFPLHDCIHYTLFRAKTLNVLFGSLLAALLGTPFAAIRDQHLQHHRDFATPEDPGAEDYFVRFRSRGELLWFLAAPLLGVTFCTRVLGYLSRLNRVADECDTKTKRNAVGLIARLSRASVVVTVQFALFCFLSSGFRLAELWRYPVFVLVPGATLFLFFMRLRMFLEHASLDYEKADYLSNLRPIARTVYGSPLERILLCGGNFNFHYEHHLYPVVPGCHLPTLHRELTGAKMEPQDVRRSYLQAFLDLWQHLGAAPQTPRARRGAA